MVITSDAGVSWTRFNHPLRYGFQPRGLRLFSRTAQLLWADAVVSGRGFAPQSLLESTDNGGATWHVLRLPTAV